MNGGSILVLVGVWFLLILFLILTLATAYFPLGIANTIINLLIAAAKAGLVIYVFMHLRTGNATIRLVASTGLLWLLLLVTLSLADYLTRQPSISPW